MNEQFDRLRAAQAQAAPQAAPAGVMPGGLSNTKVPTQGVTVQIATLKDAMNELEQTAAMLAGAVEPFLRPANPSPGEGVGGAYATMSPASEQLDNITRRVRGLTSALRELASRVDA